MSALSVRPFERHVYPEPRRTWLGRGGVDSAPHDHRRRPPGRDPHHRGPAGRFPRTRLHQRPLARHDRLPRPGAGPPAPPRRPPRHPRLIRLQCYEGLDVNTAVYEWNYPRQMLEIRLLEARGDIDRAKAHDIFSSDFLIKRPLLQALEADGSGRAPVLLIDEIDRADEEFEAYLLEILSDFQVTVPEIGTIKAEFPPRVILTSNRTREVHDALKRRCLYHWIDYPTAQKEYEIVLAKVPAAPERRGAGGGGFVHRLREADLTKVPGIAETLDWAAALMALGAAELTPELVDETLGVLLKDEEGIRQGRGG